VVLGDSRTDSRRHNVIVRFDAQPTLSGERLTVRPLREEDFAALYGGDPLVWEQHSAKDRHRPAEFRRFFGEALAGKGAPTVINDEGGVVDRRGFTAMTGGAARSRSVGRIPLGRPDQFAS
jgi:hypothetical protein